MSNQPSDVVDPAAPSRTTFLEFRRWLRHGPRAEVVSAAVGGLLALALVGWALVPLAGDGDDESALATGDFEAGEFDPDLSASGSSDGDDASAAPDAAGDDVGEASGADAPAGTSGGSAGGPSGAAAGGESPGPSTGGQQQQQQQQGRCGSLGASGPGVTADEVFVAVSLVNIVGPAGNETFGVRGDLEEMARAVTAGINAEGGIACRKLRIKTYDVNPISQAEQRAKCLEMVSAKPLAVIDYAGYVRETQRACFPENKLTYIGGQSLTEDEGSRSYPYLLSTSASTERQQRHTVLGLAERGVFDSAKGFTKLGLFLDGCYPKINKQVEDLLNQVGVPDSKISTFATSCQSIAPPTEISQGVTQHRRDVVSHVLLASSLSNSQNYVRTASGVAFRPNYLTGDYGSNTAAASEGGWEASLDGAIGITSNRSGEINSGITNARQAQCDKWMRDAGLEDGKNDGGGAYGMCDQFRLLVAAANAADPNNLTRETLWPSLPKIGRFESAAVGDAVFGPKGHSGGQFVRPIRWTADCSCWKVLAPEMKRER